MGINPEIHNWTIQRVWDFGTLHTKCDASRLRDLCIRGGEKIVTDRDSRWPQGNSIVETQQGWCSQETVEACTGPAQVQLRQKSQSWEGEVGTKSYFPTKKLFVVVIPARTEKISLQPHSKAGPTPRSCRSTQSRLHVFCVLFVYLVGWLACLIWCFVWVLIRII